MKQSGLAPILIVLLVAVLGIGGYFVYTNYANNKGSVQYGEPIKSPSQAESTSSAGTADWKTYTNTKYAYTVRYPNDWNIVDVHTDEKVTFGGKLGVDKPPLVAIHTLETSKFREEDIPSYTPFDYKILNKNGYTFLLLATTYQIGANATKETEQQAIDTLNKIYSTFKFTQ